MSDTHASETLTLAGAINAGLRAAMERDPKVLLMGEDIGALGGVFRVTDGLHKDFGGDRVMDTPLAESGIVGTAIGLAMRGYTPGGRDPVRRLHLPRLRPDHHVARQARTRARAATSHLPVVIRVPYAGGIGAIEHHSESPEVLFAHTAGLRVCTPATPQDGFDMIQQAIASPDPVLFFEPKARYWDKGEVSTRPRRRPARTPRMARWSRPPKWAARASLARALTSPWFPMARRCGWLCRPRNLLQEDGVSAEVIDLRSLSPLDSDAVVASAKKTGRVVVIHEAITTYGTGAEISARVSEQAFFHLHAPVLRVGGFHAPYPGAKYEHEYLPNIDRVLDAVDRVVAH